MRKAFAVFSALIFLTSITSATTVAAEKTVTGDEDLLFYPEEKKVSIISAYRGQTPVRENNSYTEWAEIEMAELAAEKVGQILNSSIDEPLGRISTSWTVRNGENIVLVKYPVSREGEPTMKQVSLQQLQEIAPEKVSAKVNFPGESFTQKISVELEGRAPARLLGVKSSFSSEENQWRSSIRIVNTSSPENASNRITRVNYSQEEMYTADFSGYIQLPGSCHTVEHQVVNTENAYDFNLWAEERKTSQGCDKQGVWAKYSASFRSDEPFKLDVKYAGFEKTLDYPEQRNTTEKSPEIESEDRGLLEKLLAFLGF